jgi:muramidase (phage lysozyme)
MDNTVPAGAAMLLDFIGDIEAPKGYGTIYANKQHKLAKPLTSMTLGDVVDAQAAWSKNHGSSAAGRYQFMKATLIDLSRELGLHGDQIFDANLQDRLAYHLLKRRGYEAFMAGQISRTEFGKRLAMEWASLPVLAATKGGSRSVKRGQSFYAGDGLNKSLVEPETVEALLDKVKALASKSAPAPAPSRPAPQPSARAKPAGEKTRASGSILAAFALIVVAVVLFIIFGS